MKNTDLVRLTITVGIMSILLSAPVAYAGITGDALDAAERIERLSIIGVLTCGIVASWGAFFWLLKLVMARFTAVIEANTAAMLACHDERQRKERGVK
jgi:hypothetical protein